MEFNFYLLGIWAMICGLLYGALLAKTKYRTESGSIDIVKVSLNAVLFLILLGMSAIFNVLRDGGLI